MNFFTINNNEQTKIDLIPESEDTFLISINGNDIGIDKQQLMELGVFFIASAGCNVDFSSVDELLLGYQLSNKPLIVLSRENT